MGVYFFFVLSGFLITYLLLEEKKQYSKIKIKEFYIRRILRIWPLYYLIVIIGFFILPRYEIFHITYLQDSFQKNFTPNLMSYLLILPNLAFSIFPAVPNIGQAWSIGVEEQFYLAWPWIIAKSKNILRTLVIIICGLFFLKVCVLVLGKFYNKTDWYEPLKLFVAMSKFECMAIGGIGAYLLFNSHKLLKILFNKIILVLSFILIFLLAYVSNEWIQNGIHLVYSVLFLIIILNVSGNTQKTNTESRVLNYLGKISYGIYMYHFMIIPLVLYICKNNFYSCSELIVNLILYTLTIGFTIIISSISYHLFELPFIRFKSKYSLIKSGG